MWCRGLYRQLLRSHSCSHWIATKRLSDQYRPLYDGSSALCDCGRTWLDLPTVSFCIPDMGLHHSSCCLIIAHVSCAIAIVKLHQSQFYIRLMALSFLFFYHSFISSCSSICHFLHFLITMVHGQCHLSGWNVVHWGVLVASYRSTRSSAAAEEPRDTLC